MTNGMHAIKLRTILVVILFVFCIFPLLSETSKATGDLTITYPSGGETLYQNEWYNIYWTSVDIGDYVKIELYTSWGTYYTIASSTDNDGYYEWQVLDSVSGSGFYIKVTSTQYSYISNTSGTFNINYQYITVTSPSYLSTWYKGESYSITWDADIYSSDVDIYYESDSGNNQIVSSTTNDGSYTWTLPANLMSGTGYRIKISSTFGSSYVYGYSQYFQIAERQIVVYSPSSGDILRTGKTYTIAWDGGVSEGQVNIYLEQSSGLSLIDQTENDGSYSWTVSESYYTGSSYRIVVWSDYDSNNQGYSDIFTIRREFILVNYPAENETWYKGKTRIIYWYSENAGNSFDISLYKYDKHVLTVNSNVYSYDYGSYQWDIPYDIETDYYRIKITSLSDTDLYDFSDYFTIDEQYIQVISPSENDICYKGDTYHIKWGSKNIGYNVTIELYSYLYSDYDSYSTSITYKTYNDGDFLWKIPNDLSTEKIYKIKITDSNDYSTYNFSGNFSINESITITSLANSETWAKEEPHYINWESSEIVGEYVKIELLENNDPYFIIAENTNNDGSFLWEIPDSIEESSAYKIKVSSTSNSDIYAISKGYLQIEEIALESVFNTIFILIIVVIVIVIVLVVIVKIWKTRNKNKETEDISEIENQVDEFIAPQEIKTYDISDEEYERIWEKPKK